MMIGKLEELILLATVKVGANAMPSAIYERLISAVPAGEKEPAFGAVYTTLNRMEAKKMLSASTVRDERGRDRRGFSVTAEGAKALQAGVAHSHALGAYALAMGEAL